MTLLSRVFKSVTRVMWFPGTDRCPIPRCGDSLPSTIHQVILQSSSEHLPLHFLFATAMPSLSWFAFPGLASEMSTCPTATWTPADLDCCDKMYVLWDFVSHCGSAGDAFVWQECTAMFLRSIVRHGPSTTIVEAFDVDLQQDMTIVLVHSSKDAPAQ